jgi:hypothetical protein
MPESPLVKSTLGCVEKSCVPLGLHTQVAIFKVGNTVQQLGCLDELPTAILTIPYRFTWLMSSIEEADNEQQMVR